MLDLGCADGDLAFFFEDLGCRVLAVDHPPANYNGMAGVAALKTALDSSVRIEALDLDAGVPLPLRRCGLALGFGILHRLKNPYGVLEGLARRARYCLLSTTVTRFAPDRATPVGDLAVAFLTGSDGMRGDPANYWTFSETGLRTLVDRCGWDVYDWLAPDAEDDRAFCLLRSRHFEVAAHSQLLSGWHGLEDGAWRWTERKFSLVVAPGGQRVSLKVRAEGNIKFPIVLTARSSGQEIGRHEFAAAGDYDCAQMAADGAEALVEFEMDRAMEPDTYDSRERGLMVRGVEVG